MLVHPCLTKKMRLLSVFVLRMQIYSVLPMVLQRKICGYIAISLVYPLQSQWGLEEHTISSQDVNVVPHNQCNVWAWNGSIGFIVSRGAGNACWHYLVSS